MPHFNIWTTSLLHLANDSMMIEEVFVLHLSMVQSINASIHLQVKNGIFSPQSKWAGMSHLFSVSLSLIKLRTMGGVGRRFQEVHTLLSVWLS